MNSLRRSELDSGSRGPGSSPGPGHLCCVLGEDALLSQCLFPPGNISYDGEGVAIISGGRGGSNTLKLFHAKEMVIDNGLINHLAF